MPKTAIKIGPADHGRKMSLEEFDHAEVQEGYLYELSGGVIIVSDVANLWHGVQVDEIRQMLAEYRATHRKEIARIFAGNECKILLWSDQSERHPDISVYKRTPDNQEDLWATWVADLVIEVVSAESRHRDYVEKREEYLHFGVREYWIVDYDRREVLVLRRRGKRWVEEIVRPPAVYRPKLLPGFELNVAAVFLAAEQAGR